MPDIVLHHYQGSPFSEKVRLVLGFKRMAWRSVIVPVMLPKPDVASLTGGYRRTPFMQIGADIYCDSALICRVLERLEPHPALYPGATSGLADIVSQWADGALFWAAIPYAIQSGGGSHVMAGASPEFMKAFAADRAAMTAGMRRGGVHDLRAQLLDHLARLESMLASSRGVSSGSPSGASYLLGDEPCIADFSAAQSIWFLRLAPPVAALLESFPMLVAWYGRMEAFGHGRRTEMSSDEAIALARGSTAHSFAGVTVGTGLGFERGQLVSVAATDYAADEVVGELVGLTAHESVIGREDERAGRVHVHFPRVGYRIRTASNATTETRP